MDFHVPQQASHALNLSFNDLGFSEDLIHQLESLSCGSPPNTSFVVNETKISYISDSKFIDTGVSNAIQPKYRVQKSGELWYSRSFPEGIKNCYTFDLTKGDQYLIRAWFLYGNYDGQHRGPKFELHIGPNMWKKINITKTDDTEEAQRIEIIHVLTSSALQICLVKTGSTVPFISALELRCFRNRPYFTDHGSLEPYISLDYGNLYQEFMFLENPVTVRYDSDFYDRMWTPEYYPDFLETVSIISSTLPYDAVSDYKPPNLVMRTATIPVDGFGILNLTAYVPENNSTAFCVMYFAEAQKLKENDLREFNIIYNGELYVGPISPSSHNTSVYTLTLLDGNFDFSLENTEKSTLPPSLNAMELFTFVMLPQLETDQKEAEAMMSIKRKYSVSEISWQGDPCAPQKYSWKGLGCTYSSNDPPIIISLNLSSSALTGEIPPYISNLTNLITLDLSNNNFTGSIPRFLSGMKSLAVLNLNGNNLTGSVPEDLLQRQQNGFLTLGVDGNPGLCVSCEKEKSEKNKKSMKGKKSSIIYVVASLVSLLLLSTAFATIWFFKNKKLKNLEGRPKRPDERSTNRAFSYAEVLKMTNNLERVLGRGGFGTVYQGNLDSTQVAVKIISQTSNQGYKEFKTEVDLLMKVHHKHLTCLVGYCDEDNKFALIYEFMSNGDLNAHLSGKRCTHTLNWQSRLRIAAESAQGLGYLHSGCKLPIVHRDVKPTNILLDENFQAKIADFGISRLFPTGSGTHVTTVVVGTPGYLDPEYYRTNMLTAKSDVYSYGVVLLELITNQPVIDLNREKPHISDWVGSMLGGGDIRGIVDPNLQGDFDLSSVLKVAEISVACTNPSPSGRPTMTQVEIKLNECLAEEIARTQEKTNFSQDSADVSMTFSTELNPGLR